MAPPLALSGLLFEMAEAIDWARVAAARKHHTAIELEARNLVRQKCARGIKSVERTSDTGSLNGTATVSRCIIEHSL